MPPAVLFDIDGTLVTFEFDVKATRAAMLSELSRRRFDTAALTLSSPTQRLIEAARDQIDSGANHSDYEEVRSSLFSILDAFEVESSRTARLFADTKETLSTLQERGARMAVLTNSGRRATDDLLRRTGLETYFEFVFTRDDVAAMKPSPDGISTAVSAFGVPKSEVCYVGDGVFDIMASKRAGLRVISVATGNYTAEMLRKEGADEVILSLTELPPILGIIP